MRNFLNLNKTLAIVNFLFIISIINLASLSPILVFLLLFSTFFIIFFSIYKKIPSKVYENLYRITQVAILIIFIRNYLDPFIIRSNDFGTFPTSENFIIYNLPFLVALNLALILFIVANKSEWREEIEKK